MIFHMDHEKNLLQEKRNTKAFVYDWIGCYCNRLVLKFDAAAKVRVKT